MIETLKIVFSNPSQRMRDAVGLVLALVICLLLIVFLPRSAHAAMTIDVCGHSLYQCAENEKVGASTGRSTVECDPVTADCQVKQNEIMLNPKTPLDTPSGWTAPVPPSVEPTPPSTTSSPWAAYPNVPAADYSNCSSAAGWTPGQIYYEPGTGRGVTVVSNGSPNTYPVPNGFSFSFTCFGAGFSAGIAHSNSACPAGYTRSGGTCNLTNAATVPKPSDGKCTIKRDGNSFTGDTRDPDCSVNPGVTVSGSEVTVSPKPTGTENVRYKFEADGSGTVTHSVPGTDGTTTQRTVQFGAPNPSTGDSLVTGTREAKFTGTGSLQNPSAQGELPTDYNRETTQQSILAELKKDRKIDETGTPTDGALTDQKAQFDSESDARKSAMEGIANVTNLGLGLSITWPVSSCDDPSFEIPGTSKSAVIPMCSRRGDLQAIGNWMVAIFAAFYIFTLGAGALRS